MNNKIFRNLKFISLLALGLVALSSSKAAITLNIGGSYTGATAEPANWDYLYSNQASGGTEASLTANTLIGDGPDATRQTGFGGPADSNDPVWMVSASILGSNTNSGTLNYEIWNGGDPGGNGGAQGALHNGVAGTDLLLHPGNDDVAAFVMVRYTFTSADITAHGTSATVSGSFTNGLMPLFDNGVSVFVFHNTTQVFTRNGFTTGSDPSLSTADGTFNQNLIVAAGDSISFVVGRNDGGSNMMDETALRGSISLVPEPETYALLVGFGTLGFVGLRRRF